MLRVRKTVVLIWKKLVCPQLTAGETLTAPGADNIVDVPMDSIIIMSEKLQSLLSGKSIPQLSKMKEKKIEITIITVLAICIGTNLQQPSHIKI